MSEKNKYNYLENVLRDLNGKFIYPVRQDVKKNKKILGLVLTTIVNKMKEQDPLFKAMHQRIFPGGGYYHGVKVGKPEEFDLDLFMKLPTCSELILTTSNNPRFVHLQLKKCDAWMNQPEAMPAYRTFGSLFDNDHYLDTSKVLSWIQSIITKALNAFPKNGDKTYLISSLNGTFEVGTTQGRPAHTLKISGSGVTMDVDLVPRFVLRGDQWPTAGFKSNPVTSKPEFFIVPKQPKSCSGKAARYWRLSFQEQERVLMDRPPYLKPTIILLKKLRETQNHSNITSYYIKTAVLHISDTKSEDFWRNSLSYCFMTVLKEYKDFIEKGEILYYWNKNHNLIGGCKASTLQNIASRLTVIISAIEKKPDEPKILAKYLLTPEEQLEYGVSALEI